MSKALQQDQQTELVEAALLPAPVRGAIAAAVTDWDCMECELVPLTLSFSIFVRMQKCAGTGHQGKLVAKAGRDVPSTSERTLPRLPSSIVLGRGNAKPLGRAMQRHPEPWCIAVHRHDWMRDVGHFWAAARMALGHRHWQRAADGRSPALPHRHFPIHQSRTHPWHQSGAVVVRCMADRGLLETFLRTSTAGLCLGCLR